ncbi:MAG: hypothetical protein J0H30_09950 [Alphaproteobacteria bacterium]|nr:hypothetical protein [Alphaproteobacteria bacterium]
MFTETGISHSTLTHKGRMVWRKDGKQILLIAAGARVFAIANRCPHVMDICRAERPPLFRTEPGRAVSCFLYQQNPVLPSAELDSVMVVPAAVGRQT